MAVQAQYPTIVLLHDRSLQEDTKDYSFQPQMDEDGSRFVDIRSHNNVLSNSFVVGNRLMSTVHRQQSSCNQLIDQTHLHSINAGVNTGLRLAFSDQQQEQRQQKQSVSPRSSNGWCLIPKDLSNQINQELNEIDQFLQVQSEEMRRTLAEKRESHYSALLEAADVLVSERLKDKDAAAEKAVWRKAELEARAAHLSMEAEVWKARAAEHEAVAAALQAQLQQVIAKSGGGVRCVAGNTEDAESAAYIDPEQVVMVSGPGCKSCGKRVASVVLFPCRHLCVCSECNGVVLACPLCLSLRSYSIEVYMS